MRFGYSHLYSIFYRTNENLAPVLPPYDPTVPGDYRKLIENVYSTDRIIEYIDKSDSAELLTTVRPTITLNVFLINIFYFQAVSKFPFHKLSSSHSR